MVDKAMSAIIQCHKNKLLREFEKEKTTKEMWTKHELFYTTNTLVQFFFMKQQTYSLHGGE